MTDTSTQTEAQATKHILADELQSNLKAVAVVDMGPITKYYKGLRNGEFVEILPDADQGTKKPKFGFCKDIDLAEKRGHDISVTSEDYLDEDTSRHIALMMSPILQELDESSISNERKRSSPEQADTVDKQVTADVGSVEDNLEVASAAAETSDDRDDGYERVPWDDYGSDGSDLESPAEPEVRDDIGSDE